MALFLRSDPNELLPLGIQGITRLRAFFTQLHLPDDKSRPQHPHYPHIPENPFRIGSHFASVLRFRIAQCRLSSCMIRTRVCRRTGSFPVRPAGGRLRTRWPRPVEGSKGFFAVASIFAWLFRPKPPAPGVADVTIPNPQKICRNSARTTAGRRFYPDRRGRKKPSPPYCVFCRNIHPPAFPIHPKVFFMA